MLSARAVQALLATDAPVQRLFVGEEFETWAVAPDLVAKFPRTAVEAEKMPVEAETHALVRSLLGDLVPAIRMVGEMADGSGFPFIVHERARGEQGQTIDGTTIEPALGMAEEIGAALGALHRIGSDDAFALGVGERSITFTPPIIADTTIAVLTALIGDAARAFLESSPPEPFHRRSLCHTDIKGEHIFVSDDRATVTAIIDWADTEVCDPAQDYAGLVIWLGPDFARRAIVASGEEDLSLADRAIWLARAGALDWMDAVLTGREEAPRALITQQVRAAFAD